MRNSFVFLTISGHLTRECHFSLCQWSLWSGLSEIILEEKKDNDNFFKAIHAHPIT